MLKANYKVLITLFREVLPDEDLIIFGELRYLF